MPTEIVAIVLVAALAHASWNALIKSDDDRLVTLGAINAVRFLLCIPIVLALPLPDRASWPYLAASSILHVGYYIFLISAYRFGDLSKVYPLARGLSPLIVAAGAYAFAGERLSPMALVGVAVACTGIASLSLGGGATPARSARVHTGHSPAPEMARHKRAPIAAASSSRPAPRCSSPRTRSPTRWAPGCRVTR